VNDFRAGSHSGQSLRRPPVPLRPLVAQAPRGHGWCCAGRPVVGISAAWVRFVRQQRPL